jgi:hypothetical protein
MGLVFYSIKITIMKRLFVVLLMLGIAFTSEAQLIYDFNKGEFIKGANSSNGKVSSVKTGSFVTLKIININTFRYRVELEGNSVNYITPIPSELQKVFRLQAESFNDMNLVEALGLINAANDEMKVLKTTTANKLANKATDSNKKLNESMEALTKACEEYVEIAQRVANIKYTLMQLVSLSKQKWSNYQEMNGRLPDLLSEEGMKKDYQHFVKYYAEAHTLYKKAKAAADADKENPEIGKAIEEKRKDIESAQYLFLQDNFLKLIEDVTILQLAMDDKEYFEVQSAPIQVDGDYVAFKIKITPVQINNLAPFEIAREFPVEIPASGGLKVDFSVGPAISFGSNSRSDNYYLESNKAKDSVFVRQRNNNNAISPGLAAMMHFGGRSGKDGRLAGMFGVGAGLQDAGKVNFSLYGGASFVWGKRERIMLSAGISYLLVDRLKTDQFIKDGFYDAKNIKLEDITEKVFKPSFFISISYNLTNRLEIK